MAIVYELAYRLNQAARERLPSVAIPLQNVITCMDCKVTIGSLYEHDLQTCDCGAVSVNGGFARVERRCASDAQWEEWSDAWLRDDETARNAEPADEWRSIFRAGGTRL